MFAVEENFIPAVSFFALADFVVEQVEVTQESMVLKIASSASYLTITFANQARCMRKSAGHEIFCLPALRNMVTKSDNLGTSKVSFLFLYCTKRAKLSNNNSNT